MGELIYLKDVVTLQLDPEKCTGCGTCLEVCPHQVLAMNREKGSDRQPGRLHGMRGLCPELSFRSIDGRSRSGLRRGRDQFRLGAYRRLLLLCHRAKEGRAVIRTGSPKILLLLNRHCYSK